MHPKNRKIKSKIFLFTCLASSIVSIALSGVMVSLGENPNIDALSRIGEENHALFILWGVFTAVAIYMNYLLLAHRLDITNKFFYAVLTIGCSMVIVSSSVIGEHIALRVIHVTASGLFGLLCAVCLVILLIVKIRCNYNKKRTAMYLTLMAVAGLLLVVTTIYVGWFTAYTQVLIINLCLVTMFLSNFVEKWSLE